MIAVWAREDRLATINDITRMVRSNTFPIETEDYLQGLAAAPEDLARLCVNAVTQKVFTIPMRAKRFVADVYNSFRLLNLPNGNLRKSSDAIKYSLKKIEETIYDCSVRNLITPS